MNATTASLIERLVGQGHFNSEAGCRRYFDRFFGDVPLDGKSVLEIGSGMGWLSLYAAAEGATRVVGLEPEVDGATGGVLDEFRSTIDALNLDRVAAVAEVVESYDPGGRFDLVLSSSSINHLDEDACRKLMREPVARDRYRVVFRKINALMNPGGVLIVTDSSRYNVFGTVGLRSPLAPAIEWDVHQSPRVWAKLLSTSGFEQPQISWLQPWLLEPFGVITKNAFVSYFLRSRFRLVMVKSPAAA